MDKQEELAMLREQLREQLDRLADLNADFEDVKAVLEEFGYQRQITPEDN